MSSENDIEQDSDQSSWVDSALEVFISVGATMLPFILASFPVLAAVAGQDPHPGFRASFASFFTSGEIVLPIFGVCGAIAALVYSSPNPIPRRWITGALVVVIAIVLFSGLVLGRTNGFSFDVNKPVFWGLWGLYGFLLFFWFKVHNISRTPP